MFIKLPDEGRINIDHIVNYCPIDYQYQVVIEMSTGRVASFNFESESERDNYLSYLDACCGVHQP